LFDEQGAADVCEIITSVRDDRGGMVQHAEQAEFVHRTLKNFVDANKSKDAAEDGDVLHSAIEKALNLGDPRKVPVHPSQKDGDEGNASTIPTWRLHELEEKERQAATDLDSELACDCILLTPTFVPLEVWLGGHVCCNCST
jgi:hypothetical protein